MASVNVTPNTASTFPITFTWNNGQVFNLAATQGLGCVDTVYSTSAATVNNTTTYSNYVALPPNQALPIVQGYAFQFGISNLACSSLVQQAAAWNAVYGNGTATNSLVIGPFNFSTVGDAIYSIIEIIVIVILLVVLLKFFVWLYEEAMHAGRR